MKRERNGQYSITLQRDLIADYFEDLKTSPMFVYKGNLPASSPLVYNKENMSVNQIKTKEISLRDFTDTSWIVGYIANDSFTEAQTFEVVDAGDLNSVPSIESLGISLNDATMPEQGGYIHQIPKITFLASYKEDGFFAFRKPFATNYEYSSNSFTQIYELANESEPAIYGVPGRDIPQILETIRSSFNQRVSSIVNGLDAYFSAEGIEIADNDVYNDIYSLNDKIVRSNQTGLYYKLMVGQRENIDKEVKLSSTRPSEVSLYQSAMSAMNAAANELEGKFTGVEKDAIIISYLDTKTIINLVPLPGKGTAKVSINSSHRLLEDSPYSMFCLRNTPLNLALAVKIAEKLDKKCYDLQLLPYCPVANKVELGDWSVPVPNADADKEKDFFEIFGENDEKLDYLYFATSSQGSFIIDKQISMPLSPVEIKVANDCDTYRLCSPNYNGIFEFSAIKNGGVDYFEVSYTYKPYSPYIHVNPNFKNLYGNDFNDARGLICGGDFSLPRTTDAWESYQLQNKNYLNIFDREIETMDANHGLNMGSAGAAAAFGAVGSGIAMGALGGPGFGIGAGIASAAGGIADLIIQGLTYENNKKLTIDKFNMSLQNIRALPTSLSKVGAYNIDNKIFPFLEYYTCTETEKEIYRNKIKYEAMTVNAIGTINDYLDAVDEYNFFKATPIQLHDIADDYHVAMAIAQELEKGVYL